MAEAQLGNTVKVHFTGKLRNGETFGSSAGSEPVEFTIGEHEVIPGLEEAVIGMEPGQEKSVDVAPDKGYGPHRDDLVLKVGQESFPPDFKPEVGQDLMVRQADGQTFPVKVTEVSEYEAILDANHPLAGKELTFDIKLVEVE